MDPSTYISISTPFNSVPFSHNWSIAMAFYGNCFSSNYRNGACDDKGRTTMFLVDKASGFYSIGEYWNMNLILIKYLLIIVVEGNKCLATEELKGACDLLLHYTYVWPCPLLVCTFNRAVTITYNWIKFTVFFFVSSTTITFLIHCRNKHLNIIFMIQNVFINKNWASASRKERKKRKKNKIKSIKKVFYINSWKNVLYVATYSSI